ncbi:hypothetical protein U5801_17740 [Lamprobacter modestohalophilus]|uniref:hypothetical protein n=1 Tax=Lamprobacter modestohalophilus TaxID=1064514 RepID=UPI002ADEB1A5|nr:hypothetical protein [Lamprobacter modestohalophilus]MEA1051632.1 hypothetical protein [Lamprobacter modestohalophilus]
MSNVQTASEDGGSKTIVLTVIFQEILREICRDTFSSDKAVTFSDYFLSCSVKFFRGDYIRIHRLPPSPIHGVRCGEIISKNTYDRRVAEYLQRGFYYIYLSHDKKIKVQSNSVLDPVYAHLGIFEKRSILLMDLSKFNPRFRLGSTARDGSLSYVGFFIDKPEIFLISNGLPWVAIFPYTEDTGNSQEKAVREKMDLILRRVLAFFLDLDYSKFIEQFQPAKKLNGPLALYVKNPFPAHFGHYITNILWPLDQISSKDWEVDRIFLDREDRRYFSHDLENAISWPMSTDFVHRVSATSDFGNNFLLSYNTGKCRVEFSRKVQEFFRKNTDNNIDLKQSISIEIRSDTRALKNSAEVFKELLMYLKTMFPDLTVMIDGISGDTAHLPVYIEEIKSSSQIASELVSCVYKEGMFSPGEITSIIGMPIEKQLSALVGTSLAICSFGGGIAKNYFLLQSPTYAVASPSLIRQYTDEEEIFNCFPLLFDELGVDRGWGVKNHFPLDDLHAVAPFFYLPTKFSSNDIEGKRWSYEIKDVNGFKESVAAALKAALDWRKRQGSKSALQDFSRV